jgi:hypothetical protein
LGVVNVRLSGNDTLTHARIYSMIAVPVTSLRKRTRRFVSVRNALAGLVISAGCVVFLLSTPAGAGALFGYLQI